MGTLSTNRSSKDSMINVITGDRLPEVGPPLAERSEAIFVHRDCFVAKAPRNDTRHQVWYPEVSMKEAQ
jgi:hypothetical protein